MSPLIDVFIVPEPILNAFTDVSDVSIYLYFILMIVIAIIIGVSYSSTHVHADP